MKSFGQRILIGYIVIGGMLSIVIGASYLYATYFIVWKFGWEIFSFSGVAAIVMSIGMLIISTFFRALFWLPSLLWWLNTDQDNFWLWLAPGVFAS